ncbi:hypothetical protein CRYUN_Cryun22dG0037300 [Craigia yunnanensis]
MGTLETGKDAAQIFSEVRSATKKKTKRMEQQQPDSSEDSGQSQTDKLPEEAFKRPFCDDFLRFCCERFKVGIWSSRNRKNVERFIDFLVGDMKCKLLFCWDSSYCTVTQFNTPGYKYKPMVFKELRKIWGKHDLDLPWEKGYYNESNTLLIDDSPYKALLNPPHTAIFPHSFKFDRGDNSLGAGGDLKVYLERLASAENVQNFIEQNPFCQLPITERSHEWGFYSQVINTCVHSELQNNAGFPA